MSKNLIYISDFSKEEIYKIFKLVDKLEKSEDKAKILEGKTIVLFFPESSIRTRVTLEKANQGAILNPCPPFFRGEEVSEDVINSDYFAGYGFKKNLLSPCLV